MWASRFCTTVTYVYKWQAALTLQKKTDFVGEERKKKMQEFDAYMKDILICNFWNRNYGSL